LASDVKGRIYRLRMLENRVLKRIFEPKRDEILRVKGKVHDEELHNMFSSRNILRMITSRRMRWEVHVTRMGEKWNAYRVLVRKPEGKRPRG
jgi:hypothetical protein